MTTSPLRCIMPKIGGFSFSSVPRPRSPFSRRRRPGRFFFDLLGFTLMSCHYIDFVAFHFAAERDLRLSFKDALTKLSGHLLGIVTVQIQLLSKLFIREIQPHKIEAEHPDAQRLVVTGKDRPGEVVEPLPTDGALILLSCRLGFVVPLFRDLGRVAVGAGHPLGPTHRSDGLKAPGIVNEFKMFNIRAHTILDSEKPSAKSRLQGRDYTLPSCILE